MNTSKPTPETVYSASVAMPPQNHSAVSPQRKLDVRQSRKHSFMGSILCDLKRTAAELYESVASKIVAMGWTRPNHSHARSKDRIRAFKQLSFQEQLADSAKLQQATGRNQIHEGSALKVSTKLPAQADVALAKQENGRATEASHSSSDLGRLPSGAGEEVENQAEKLRLVCNEIVVRRVQLYWYSSSHRKPLLGVETFSGAQIDESGKTGQSGVTTPKEPLPNLKEQNDAGRDIPAPAGTDKLLKDAEYSPRRLRPRLSEYELAKLRQRLGLPEPEPSSYSKPEKAKHQEKLVLPPNWKEPVLWPKPTDEATEQDWGNHPGLRARLSEDELDKMRERLGLTSMEDAGTRGGTRDKHPTEAPVTRKQVKQQVAAEEPVASPLEEQHEVHPTLPGDAKPEWGIPLAKSFEQQLATLRMQGLEVADTAAATAFLSRVNIWSLQRYLQHLRTDAADPRSKFRTGTCFEDICELYFAERELSERIGTLMHQVEAMLRTRFAYANVAMYGAQDNFLERMGFFDSKKSAVTSLSRTLAQQFMRSAAEPLKVIRKQRRRGQSLELEKFSQVPIWVLAEACSFGVLVQLIQASKKCGVLQQMARDLELSVEDLMHMLYAFVYLRNSIAHNGALWNVHHPLKDELPMDALEEHIASNISYDPKSLYAILVALSLLAQRAGIADNWLHDELEPFLNLHPTLREGIMHPKEVGMASSHAPDKVQTELAA